MRDFMAVAKALADENRVRMLLALKDRELCVCQIIELMGLAPSTVSKHMSILRQAQLVEGRKEGRWMHYRLTQTAAPSAVLDALRWVRSSLADDPQMARDAERLKHILKLKPQVLCDKQSGAARRKVSKPVRR